MEYDAIRRFKKIDLHRHLDGDVRPGVMQFIAKKNGIALPVQSNESLEDYFVRLKQDGLPALFQKGFGFVSLLSQTPDNLFLIAYEVVRNLHEDGIIYAEIRFAPQYHTGESTYYGHAGKRMSYEEVIHAIAAGLKAGERKFGVMTKMIVCIGREAEPEVGCEIVKSALNTMHLGVVGIDLACDEAAYPPERHLSAYRLTFDTPLRRTVHAGEFGPQPYRNMATAIHDLRAHRLGQAIPLVRHRGLLAAVRDNQIGVEFCPQSNLFCGHIGHVRDLGIETCLAEGIHVSINSDDPAMFGYTLTDTFATLNKYTSLTPIDLSTMMHSAMQSAFCSEEEKDKILALIDIQK
ncbi:MAG: adenosine deaminase [Patescibacteria group bacterium]|nr:adenosine deaminase [Patescibacteria group bacterium]MDE2438866.1 adenosine deaminase [Patescibacteria group bacterium]